MALLIDSFKELLSNIQPDTEARKLAISAHEPVREFLEDDDDSAKDFKKTFLYGSYGRDTAICEIKDVDIVTLSNFDPNNIDPTTALRKLKSALAKHYENPEMLEYQRRSIRVDQPLPSKKSSLTLDVIPAVAINGEDKPLLVPDRESKEWVWTNPKGHMEHTTSLNDVDYSNQMFVPLVKIMKWWWKHQTQVNMPKVERPKPKGFWIECLTGENFDPKTNTYAEHFEKVLNSVVSKYSNSKSVPELSDPGLPGETIKTNMTLDEFNKFIQIATESLVLSRTAIAVQDEEESSKIWQEIFGDKFPQSSSVKKSVSPVISPCPRDNDSDQNEQFLDDLGFIYRNGGYELKIETIIEQQGFRPFLLIFGNYIKKTCKISLKITRDNFPQNHRIYWKVKNRGEEARSLNQLRGQILPDGGKKERIEHSKYSGDHYVECYAIDDNNVCVAMDRVDIKIP